MEEDLSPPNELLGLSDDDAQDCFAGFGELLRRFMALEEGPMQAEKFLFVQVLYMW